MKQAWMPMGCVAGLLFLGAGCSDQLAIWNWHSDGAGQHHRPIASEPIAPSQSGDQAIGEPQKIAEGSTSPQEPAEQVDQRILDYVDRLTAKKPEASKAAGQQELTNPTRDRQTADVSTSPNRDRQGADFSTIEPPLPVANASQKAVEVTSPTAVPAAAPQRTERSASPAPRVVQPAAGTVPGRAQGLHVELTDVRPVANPSASAVKPARSAAANQPVQEVRKPSTGSVSSMIEQLERSVKEHPEQIDDQFQLRLLYLATGQNDKAVESMKGIDPRYVDLLKAMFQTVSQTQHLLSDPSSPSPEALAAAEELRRQLSQSLPVIIPRIALVTRVSSFGDYEAVSPARFSAGQPIYVFLYTEVANYRSEPTADGRLKTVLSEKVEIFDSAGKVIWQRQEPEIVDQVITPRKDFFIPFPVQLPADTPPGDYILKATVEDKIGATTDQQRLTFVIADH